MIAEPLVELMRRDGPRLEKPEITNPDPIYVCAQQRGLRKGDVCGTIFWDGRPEICPRCGTHYPPK